MATIKIIGTSHISPESVQKVEKTIIERKPEMVAIELDKKRFLSLVHGGNEKPKFSDIRRIGFKGWIFALVAGWLERKLGQKTGILPGTEMLRAADAARTVSAKIALIDQDIEITLKKFSKRLTWKEKW